MANNVPAHFRIWTRRQGGHWMQHRTVIQSAFEAHITACWTFFRVYIPAIKVITGSTKHANRTVAIIQCVRFRQTFSRGFGRIDIILGWWIFSIRVDKITVLSPTFFSKLANNSIRPCLLSFRVCKVTVWTSATCSILTQYSTSLLCHFRVQKPLL